MLISGIGILVLDLCTKTMVRLRLEGRSLSCGRLLRFVYVANARPLYRSAPLRLALVLIWLAALGSSILLYRGGWFGSSVASCGIGFALGGAFGNLLDVLRRRSVVDFIDLGWWPVFNLADVAIVGGLATALWHSL